MKGLQEIEARYAAGASWPEDVATLIAAVKFAESGLQKAIRIKTDRFHNATGLLVLLRRVVRRTLAMLDNGDFGK